MAFSTSMVAYYGLNAASGGETDSLGAHNMTEAVGTVGTMTGKKGNARTFSSSQLGATNHADFSPGTGDFSISCWIRPNSKSANMGPITKWNTGGDNREWALYFAGSPNPIRFTISPDGTGTGLVNAVWPTILTNGVWYHVYCFVDSTTNVVGISVNSGTPVTESYSGTVFAGNADLRIGGGVNGIVAYDGAVDEVAIWKRLLTTSERRFLYANDAGRTYANLQAADVSTRRRRLLTCGV